MQKSHFVLLIGTLGAALTAAIVLFPYDPSDFDDTPEFIIWAFIAATQIAFSAVIVWPIAELLPRLYNLANRDLTSVGLSLAIVVVLVAFPSVVGKTFTADIGPSESSLPYMQTKVIVITVLVFLVALLPVTVSVLVSSALSAANKDQAQAESNYDLYLELRNNLQKAILVSGVLFGFGMLTTGAMFEFRFEGFDPDNGDARFKLLALYGAYLSVVSALVYVPVYLRLRVFGYEVLDTLVKLPPPNAANWMDQNKKRKTVEEFMQLSIRSLPGIQAGVPILIPLIGAIIPIVISRA